MLTRRQFTLSSLTSLTYMGLATTPLLSHAASTQHFVKMLSIDPNNTSISNIFDPLILYISSHDKVTFLPSEVGHNSASKKGMVPEGGETWNSAVDQEFSVTLTIPGVYGYICFPHYDMGMVGLIVVDNDISNIKSLKKVRHLGSARKVFRALIKEVESKLG